MHYSLYLIAQIYELIVDNLFIYKQPVTYIFYATPNVPKSCTM